MITKGRHDLMPRVADIEVADDMVDEWDDQEEECLDGGEIN